jgi:hypothetical protein
MGEKSREGRREGRESRVEGVEWESRESREGDDEKREGDDELGREKCQVPQSRYCGIGIYLKPPKVGKVGNLERMSQPINLLSMGQPASLR